MQLCHHCPLPGYEMLTQSRHLLGLTFPQCSPRCLGVPDAHGIPGPGIISAFPDRVCPLSAQHRYSPLLHAQKKNMKHIFFCALVSNDSVICAGS